MKPNHLITILKYPCSKLKKPLYFINRAKIFLCYKIANMGLYKMLCVAWKCCNMCRKSNKKDLLFYLLFSNNTLKTIYYSPVHSYPSFCTPIQNCASNANNQLIFKIQKKAIQEIMVNIFDSCTENNTYILLCLH